MIAGVSAALGVVDLLVVCGNIFVLYVLASQKSLHSPTNFLVLSLTISDLLLGLIILPFSIMQEHKHAWVFGETMCSIWLALDVWFSTASIYNLLAISFDRYMAVRQPIKYPIISSTKVIRLMIFAVWAVSLALACILLLFQFGGERPPNAECIPLHLPNVYILFSATFSFILPAVIMIVLNVCIFRTVLTTSRSKCVSVKSGASMRIHRGNTNLKFQALSHNVREISNDGSEGITRSKRSNAKCSVAQKEPLMRSSSTGVALHQVVTQMMRKKGMDKAQSVDNHRMAHQSNMAPVHPSPPTKSPRISRNTLNESEEKDTPTSPETPSPLPTIKTLFSHVMVVSLVPNKKKKSEIMHQIANGTRQHRFSMRTELRVARTTAVVVGAFVICWFPFTTIYVLQAYEMCAMPTCIPKWMFLIAFWLGYSNSAVNPLLYAAFSRDFRAAFRKVLLRPSSFRNDGKSF